MARLHKMKLVSRTDKIDVIRPKGYRNLQLTHPEVVADTIKKWDLKEGVPVFVLAELQDKYFNLVGLDPDPSVGY